MGILDRYTILETIGEGAFSSVKKVQSKETGEFLAMKQFKTKFKKWSDVLDLREVHALKKLVHPNIIRLKEVIREQDILYMFFEFCVGNVHQLISAAAISSPSRTPGIPLDLIRSIMSQVFSGLSHMHRHGFFHRDLKPENLLLSTWPPQIPYPQTQNQKSLASSPITDTPTDTGSTSLPRNPFIKIADFGLAREIRSRPPYTEYVSTRWYRAPELILRFPIYNSPVDIWAAGCIMAELFLLRPLFPGSSENDVLYRQVQLLGTPTPSVWPEGARVSSRAGEPFSWPSMSPVPLNTVIPNAPPDALAVIAACLTWSPQRRPTADHVLGMKFFSDFPTTSDTPSPQTPTALHDDSADRNDPDTPHTVDLITRSNQVR